MNILLSNNSRIPLYLQIKHQIKQKILEGSLRPGEKLPSMRALANLLEISMITTKKAYEDLEREGLLKTYVGKGTFVTKEVHDLSDLKQTQIEDLKTEIKRYIFEVKNLGVSKKDLINWIEEYYDQEGSECMRLN